MNTQSVYVLIGCCYSRFTRAAQDESYDHKSFEPYKISKTALNALTREQQKGFDNDSTRKGIIVSAVHPGEVLTGILYS